MSNDPGDEQLVGIDVTRDRETARTLWRILEQVRDRDEDPLRREIADEILSGRLTVRQAASFSQYQEALTQGLEGGGRGIHGERRGD